jgi:hypothetical protein
MCREMPDPFPCHPCLDDFDIHAGDGHFIAAASHDKAKPRKDPSTTLATRAAATPSSSHPENGPIDSAAECLTQRTVKFIRWLKYHLDLERDWDHAIARLTQIYAHL